MATTAISSMVSAVQNPFAGNSPTAPVESPLPWMMMAAARQDFGRTPSLNKAVSAVTTSDDRRSGIQRSGRNRHGTARHRHTADVASATVAAASRRRAIVRDAGRRAHSPDTLRRRRSASDHRLSAWSDGRHDAAGREGDLVRRHPYLRPFLPGAGSGEGDAGADDPERPGPGPSRRDKPHCCRQSVPAQPGHRDGPAACRTATTSSRGIRAANGVRAAGSRSTRRNSRAKTCRPSSVGWLSSPRSNSTRPMIRGSAWSAPRMAAVFSW